MLSHFSEEKCMPQSVAYFLISKPGNEVFEGHSEYKFCLKNVDYKAFENPLSNFGQVAWPPVNNVFITLFLVPPTRSFNMPGKQRRQPTPTL